MGQIDFNIRYFISQMVSVWVCVIVGVVALALGLSVFYSMCVAVSLECIAAGTLAMREAQRKRRPDGVHDFCGMCGQALPIVEDAE